MLREIPRLHPNSVLLFLIIPIDISVFSEFFPSQRGLVKIVENIGLFQQLINFFPHLKDAKITVRIRS